MSIDLDVLGQATVSDETLSAMVASRWSSCSVMLLSGRAEEFPYDEGARKQLAAGQTHLQAVERELSMLEFFDYDGVDDMLREYVQDQAVPMGKVMMPLRAALTGTTSAPGVVDLIVILGKRRALARIGRALTFIDAGLPDDDPQKALEEARRQEEAAKRGKPVAKAKGHG